MHKVGTDIVQKARLRVEEWFPICLPRLLWAPPAPAFDAMSRFCGLASTTGRSLSGIPVPTIQSLATECGHKIFVPGGDKLAEEVFGI